MSEHEVVRNWPKKCPRCGTRADPLFDEPWKTDAEGVELQEQLKDPETGAAYRDAWQAWKVRAALRRSDRAVVDAARADARNYAEERREEPSWQPGNLFSACVAASLEAGDLDGAAAELLHWLRLTDASDISDDDNWRRTGCRQVVSATERLLSVPGAADLALAAEIREGCLEVAGGAFPQLLPDQQDFVLRLEQHPLGLSTRPARAEPLVAAPRLGDRPLVAAPRPGDRISADALALYGRANFLGSDQTGMDSADAYQLVAPLNELVFTSEPADRSRLLAELGRHSSRGEWHKVGAWKYVTDFLEEDDQTWPLIEEGLRAVKHMRVTNLGFHLSINDKARWRRTIGSEPPDDGFWGPPVFDSTFGPSKSHYFAEAAAAAARRHVTRVPNVSGKDPGEVGRTVNALHNFALLVYRGPLLAHPDQRFERNVVRPAVASATRVDHTRWIEQAREAILAPSAEGSTLWPALGAARFAEDYLDLRASETAAHRALLDHGLSEMLRLRMFGLATTVELLTPRQRSRLDALAP